MSKGYNALAQRRALSQTCARAFWTIIRLHFLKRHFSRDLKANDQTRSRRAEKTPQTYQRSETTKKRRRRRRRWHLAARDDDDDDDSRPPTNTKRLWRRRDDDDGGRQSRRGETRDEESDEEGEVFRECVRVACIIILFSEARDGGTLGRLGPVVPTVVFFSSLPIV